MPKNIVVCCDGTNNEVADNQTNVLRLFRMLPPADNQQIAFYDAGVGTNADPTAQWRIRRWVHKKLDGGIVVSVRDNVLKGYRFIVDHFQPEDRIFLFGFSRGAYTVRALAAMIKRCGLLWPAHSHLAAYAWSVFTDEDRSNDTRTKFAGPARIKKVFGRKVDVHFVGVWDTVSSFGWFWDLLTIPNTRTNNIVRHIRHAVSVDERRSCFPPNLVERYRDQDVIEVWFPGVHADVGGGYPDFEASLARISLQWMIREAQACGLLVDAGRQQELLKRLGTKDMLDAHGSAHDESKKIGWRLIGLFPRRGYCAAKGRSAISVINFARRREIPEGALIHQSVMTRMHEPTLNYRPKLPKSYTVVN